MSETVRVLAQGRAYDPGRPAELRRRWAKVSLLANRRALARGERLHGRVAQQEFMLRTWVIDRLGPDDADPDWSPGALAADTLGALTLRPARAAALADGWRGLPLPRIRELRQHKNLTAHLECLVGYVGPGRARAELAHWIAVRRLLP